MALGLYVPAAGWTPSRPTESDEQPSPKVANSNALSDKSANGIADRSRKVNAVLAEKSPRDARKKLRLVHIKSDPPGALVRSRDWSQRPQSRPHSRSLPPQSHHVFLRCQRFREWAGTPQSLQALGLFFIQCVRIKSHRLQPLLKFHQRYPDAWPAPVNESSF